MSSQLPVKQRQLPTIEQLYNEDTKIELAQQNQLNQLLNQSPNPKWLKERDGIKYMPIERVEWLLTAIFINWFVEIKEVKLIANSVCLVIRLHYQSPITGEMIWQDGTGAMPLQTNKGAGATDFNAIKSLAVQMAAPAAESFAVKDAAEKIGKIFGKDMNRAGQINYDNLENKFNEQDKASIKIKEEIAKEFEKRKPDEAIEFMDCQINIETLQELCAGKESAGEFTIEFANNVLNALKNGR